MSVLLFAACGGLSNAPLRTGAIEGTVSGADAASGLVTVLGRPELRAGLDSDGRFTLPRVPVGEVELFVIASRTAAVRVLATVGAAKTTALSIQPVPGAFVRYRLNTAGMQSGAQLWLSLEGTPYLGLPFERDGERRIGPLPAGCYLARIRGDAFGERLVDTCVGAGDEREIGVDFTDAPARCEQTGCEAGLLCGPDGRCVECLDSSVCADGLSCLAGRCQGQVAACAPCTADAQCGGHSCESASGGDLRFCAVSCTGSCPQPGFTCEQGLCVPNPDVFESCSGYNRVGTPCDSDSYCRDVGIYEGRCEQGACTMRCAANADCPNGTICTPAGSESFCLRP